MYVSERRTSVVRVAECVCVCVRIKGLYCWNEKQMLGGILLTAAHFPLLSVSRSCKVFSLLHFAFCLTFFQCILAEIIYFNVTIEQALIKTSQAS